MIRSWDFLIGSSDSLKINVLKSLIALREQSFRPSEFVDEYAHLCHLIDDFCQDIMLNVEDFDAKCEALNDKV